jgi:hypothetical protein
MTRRITVSDCSACINFGDGEEGSSVYRLVHRKARKAHVCCECREAINPGDEYEYATGLQDGAWWDQTTCLACADIATSLNCGTYREHGTLWENVAYVGARNIGTGCLSKLATATGKAKLQAWCAKELLDD